ncbi:hypothetical protein [Ostreiculturibacter nitratireducens]|uniref:hypothetical protein n=1 Tax=Ostreiculturibacter nitratireducens TaxID=3075226 RepID=UPI0031B57EBA
MTAAIAAGRTNPFKVVSNACLLDAPGFRDHAFRRHVFTNQPVAQHTAGPINETLQVFGFFQNFLWTNKVDGMAKGNSRQKCH